MYCMLPVQNWSEKKIMIKDKLSSVDYPCTCIYWDNIFLHESKSWAKPIECHAQKSGKGKRLIVRQRYNHNTSLLLPGWCQCPFTVVMAFQNTLLGLGFVFTHVLQLVESTSIMWMILSDTEGCDVSSTCTLKLFVLPCIN